jgi:hypothetical protein
LPAAPTKYPYLSWKHRKIVLRLPIPKPAQPILGKQMFRCIMAQSGMASAHAASLPILADWQRQIADAQAASRDYLQAEIMQFRKAFETWQDRPLTAAEIDLHDRIMDFLFETCGGISVAQQRLALADAKGRVALALPAPAQQPLALITGMTQPTTPFHALLEEWQAKTHLHICVASTSIKLS